MSPREKKLITLFAVAGFVMVNLVGLSLYKKKSAQIETGLQQAENSLQGWQMLVASAEQKYEEMEWLQKHMPEPAEYENVQTALHTYCNTEAKRFGLTVKDWDPVKPEQDNAAHFQRIKIVYRVSGMEENLYRWLDRINTPSQLRASTKLTLSPNDQDKTRIDCIATVEQWFVPVAPST